MYKPKRWNFSTVRRNCPTCADDGRANDERMVDMMIIIKASDIKVGTQLAEEDGFLFDVVEIVKETEKSITVRLCSDFSSIPAHWTTKKDGTPGGVIKTFRKSSKLYGIA